MEDVADRLELARLREEPELYERVVTEYQSRASSDEQVQALLRDTYYDADRAAAFRRFSESDELAATLRVLDRLGVSKDARLVEVGGGPGFLTHALTQRGYRVELVEPNGLWNTGTGYLESRPEMREVRVWNDLDAWYGLRDLRYDVVLTHNCVHHFRPVQYVAACLRQKLETRGRWVMLREWFAETPEETYRRLAEHPWSQSHALYEFPYPASHFVAALEQVGFELDQVFLGPYAGGALQTGRSVHGFRSDAFTWMNDVLNRAAPVIPKVAFRTAAIAARHGITSARSLARPPALVFRRRALASG